MLTPEQIKNLKKGDKLALSHPLTFREYDSENDELLAKNNGEFIYFHADDVELLSNSQPKHDPCRLFKKGDKVRLKREINGRLLNHCFFNFAYDKIYTIKEDEVQKECQSGHVTITDGEHNCTLRFYELELVTPVEELEPYYVEEQDPCYVVGKRQEAPETEYVAGFSKNRHPHAKEAAEAERDRLNAEYRKEQK